MRSKLVLFLFIISNYSCYSQSFDTTRVMLNIKFQLIEYSNGNRDTSFYRNLMSAKLNYKLLNSKGFDDYLFFMISLNPFRDTVNKEVVFNYVGDLVIGVSKSSLDIYKLRGFKENDFLKMPNKSYDCAFYKDKTLSTDFFIEGLDLKCLCKHLLKEQKKVKYSPCTKPLPTPEQVSGVRFW